MKAWLSNLSLALLSILFIFIIIGIWQFKDRHPDIDLEAKFLQASGKIKVGFAALPITPSNFESWTDVDQDAQYDSEIDLYEDANNNRKFDALWLAGFQPGRPANTIHDPLLASAMVIQVGDKKIGLLSLDVIGLSNDICWEIRKKVADRCDIDHSYIIATHNHQGPDLVGMWGKNSFQCGLDKEYLAWLIEQGTASLVLASESTQPAQITLASDTIESLNLMQDTRAPFVLDPTINILQAKSLSSGKIIGTMVNWGNHVETLWSDNLGLSSDFVHFLREGISKGIANEDEILVPAQGGVTIFVPGSIGGLMTSGPELSIRNPLTKSVHTKPGIDKAKAQGYALAEIVYLALKGEKNPRFFQTTLQSAQQPLLLSLDNWTFRIGAYLGIIDRGMPGWMKVRSEIGFWQLGPASFAHIPGELYPELAIGGLEEPAGADFPNKALEIPPIKFMMPGEYKWIVGLSNDMIGYIIPRSQWDQKAPFTYDDTIPPYGEIMSLGPETAPSIHAALLTLISRSTLDSSQNLIQ